MMMYHLRLLQISAAQRVSNVYLAKPALLVLNLFIDIH